MSANSLHNDPFLTHSTPAKAPPTGTSYIPEAKALPNHPPPMSQQKPPPMGQPMPMQTGVGRMSVTQLVALIVFPMIVHVTCMGLWVYMYHYASEVVWALIVLLSLAGIFGMSVGTAGQRFYFHLGSLIILATIAGSVSGAWIYEVAMRPVHNFEENREYRNVVPSDRAAAHSDAGVLVFSSSSLLDISKSVGYKSGKTYCVAPIIDKSSANSGRVEYWAVGIDCCEMRAKFYCDAAANPTARSGMVVFDYQGIAGQVMESPHDHYMKAIREAEASYDLVAPKEPMMVRWVQNPETIKNEKINHGLAIGIVANTGYLIFSILVGVFIYQLNARASQATR